MQSKPIADFDPPRHGYGNLTITHLYAPHLLLQAFPFLPLRSEEDGDEYGASACFRLYT